MLTLISIKSPSDQQKVLSSFDPKVATWVVSDLKSKLDLNRILLRERDFLPGESVMRASELWKTLLTRARPDLQVISREFAITLISERIESLHLDWLQSPGSAQTAYGYVTQLMPILAHPDGEAMMREWFSNNPACEVRWGRWFDLALKLWSTFLEEGFVAPPWISGVLVNESELHEVWSRPLFVDLGAELNQVEADLLVQLSSNTFSPLDVSVLRPNPSWESEYQKTLVAYDIFDRKLKVERVQIEPSASERPSKKEFRKYTTMIAEVKDATAQVRHWLEEGVESHSIAIAAPDIETYWPALLSYLQQEGIPTQKDHVRRLHGFPDITQWFARQRLRTGSFAEADIELSLFEVNSGEKRSISYERFKTLYSSLYDREDLERSEDVAKKFSIELSKNDRAIRDDFIAWSLKQLPEVSDYKRVESLFKRLFAECPQGTTLTVHRWLAYLEQLASRIECRLRDGDPKGVSIINLTSAENSPATHMMILGLSEAALKNGGGTAILFSDISKLAQDFGFYLDSEDQSRLEFETRWVMESASRHFVLSVPETDFAGSVLAASWLWVRGAREESPEGKIKIPEMTRWDEIQRSGAQVIAKERGWQGSQLEYLLHSLSEDIGDAAPEAFGTDLVKSLSPSAIEDYLDCPFIFAAKRLFRLSDVAELDLEVDASRRGSLMHALFEELTAEPMRFQYTDEEIKSVVETAKEKAGVELADPRLWPPLKTRYVDLAKRFVAFEKDYRAQFPELRTIGRELDITGYLRPETGELVPTPQPGALKFIGSIDRVDEDKDGHLAIMDYKSSAASAAQYGSWIKKNQIQLLLYAIAIENGLTPLDPRPVLAALYYVARPLGRDYGFKVEDVTQGLFDVGDKRKKNRITSDEKSRLFDEGQELVKNAVSRILAGDFTPNPRDRKDCVECQWSALCRAPHLST